MLCRLPINSTLTPLTRALTASSEGRVQANVIDRTFIENRERWIIDYKTTEIDNALDEAALKARADIHRPQMERYKALFAQEALPTRTAIFFIRASRLVEL